MFLSVVQQRTQHTLERFRQQIRAGKMSHYLAMGFLAFVGLYLLVAAAFSALYHSLPDPKRMVRQPLPMEGLTRMLADKGFPAVNLNRVTYWPVPLASVSPELKTALLRAKDCRYEKYGTNHLEMYQAVFSDKQEGCTFLSRHLAKMLYLSERQAFPSMLEEALLAIRIENDLEEDELLSVFLNTVYLGQGAYGVEAASQAYFRQSARNLSKEDAALLARLLKDPAQADQVVRKIESRRNFLAQSQALLDADEARKQAMAGLKEVGLPSANANIQAVSVPVSGVAAAPAPKPQYQPARIERLAPRRAPAKPYVAPPAAVAVHSEGDMFEPDDRPVTRKVKKGWKKVKKWTKKTWNKIKDDEPS